MKPAKITDILDLAQRVRKIGKDYVPLFTGAPGIGKSALCKEWVKTQQRKDPTFGFVDLRAAYLEAPDVIGFPHIDSVDGVKRMLHALPEIWPTSGSGLLLLEEPNRGTTSVMNTFMQLLTDRQVHLNYKLPPGWVIAGCINPENEHYDVNTMDAALKNRFEIYDIEYDGVEFVKYMKSAEWDKDVIRFVESGLWQYQNPETLGNMPGTKYNSPRSLEKISNAKLAGINRDDEMTVFEASLGRGMAKAFYGFLYEETPVLLSDILSEKKKSLKKLESQSDPKKYQNALLSVTVIDIVENFKAIPEKELEQVLSEVALAIPMDHGYQMFTRIQMQKGDFKLLERVIGAFPKLKEHYQNVKSGK